MQATKAMQSSKIDTKAVALTAMFAALVMTATAFIKIPAPLGYVHAGDSVVFLSACVLPGPLGFLAAAIGGALADIISGYAVWALPTAIIKALNVLPFFIARLILKRKNKDQRILSPSIIAAFTASMAVTVGGYYAADALLYDYTAALAEIPFNSMQAVIGTVLFVALALALDAVKLKQRLFR